MSQQQNYNNHIRFYPPHHFVFYPVMLLLMGYCGYKAFEDDGLKEVWVVLGVAFFAVTWLGFMLRQHYALTLQNRIVINELRYRYFVLTGKRLEEIEPLLTEGQLFALRFAPDSEFEGLLNRAVSEKLSADAIKRAIQQWQGDYRRV